MYMLDIADSNIHVYKGYLLWIGCIYLPCYLHISQMQRAKKVVSDSPGLVNFAIRLVISILNLHNGQMNFGGGIQITEEL